MRYEKALTSLECPVDPLSTFGIFAFVFGLLIGSFLNVVIARLPVGKSVVHPPSHCPCCGTPIRAYDNIPIVPWLALGANAVPVTRRFRIYPAVSLLTGLLAWLLYRTTFIDISTLSALSAAFGLLCIDCHAGAQHSSTFAITLRPQLSIGAVPFAISAMAVLAEVGYPFIGWKAKVLGRRACFWPWRPSGGCFAVRLAWEWGMSAVGAHRGICGVACLALHHLVASLSASLIGVPIPLSKGGLRYALPFGPFRHLRPLSGFSEGLYWSNAGFLLINRLPLKFLAQSKKILRKHQMALD